MASREARKYNQVRFCMRKNPQNVSPWVGPLRLHYPPNALKHHMINGRPLREGEEYILRHPALLCPWANVITS